MVVGGLSVMAAFGEASDHGRAGGQRTEKREERIEKKEQVAAARRTGAKVSSFLS